MELSEEKLKCPICVDLFTEPVLLPCGHNFCRTCIRVVWNMDESKESPAGPLFCPECQIFLPSDLKLEINVDLQRHAQDFAAREPITEQTQMSDESSKVMCDHCLERAAVAVKSCLNCDASLCLAHTLVHQQKEALRGHTLIEVTEDLVSFKCREHSEELKLFCQEDQAAVCSLCVVVGTHKNHQVIQLPEACSDFKKVLEANEAVLLERRCTVECAMKDLEPLFSGVMSSAQACRAKIAEKYQQIKAQIEDDEKLMMSVLEAEELYTKKWLKTKRECLEYHIRDTNALMSTNQTLIQETNNLKLLQVDRECCASERMRTVEHLVDQLHEAVFQSSHRVWSYLRAITLNPESAHPKLEVLADGLEVRWGKQTTQEKRDSEQLNSQYSVLASQSFSSDSHYWEVAVWEKPYWLIGVAYGPQYRTGEQDLCLSNETNEVFCYIYHGNGKYLACHDSVETVLKVRKRVQKVGIWVNLQKGELLFYDADTLTVLHSFSVKFLDAIYPTFNPCLDLNDQNRQPLILVHLRGIPEAPASVEITFQVSKRIL
ncbi:nuclear factor 7, ovary [Chanos chanos]|uniref:Nuclear factor 7, ovary n=1 Tax=Chanos chanos TaxID=29144 RepID=A0A6J2VAP3_CHACN|nr:nuclear factor 7, ovary-like [Chanos chanos]